MTIHTKFDVGQDVFFMEDNKVVSKPIDSINFQAINKGNVNEPVSLTQRLVYGFRVVTSKGAFLRWDEKDESLIFPTKEALLATL